MNRLQGLACLSVILNILLSYVTPIEGRKILFFGDSVLRGIMTDWCERLTEMNNQTVIQDWGRIELKYGASILKLHSPGICSFGEDSIAQVHLFGSNLKGPYYSDKWEKESSPMEVRDTDWRIEKGLAEYILHFGLPDKIFMTTCNWDHAGAGFFKEDMTMSRFENNTLYLLQYIRSLLPSNATVENVDIGLTTCPLDYSLHDQIIDFNQYYRNVSVDKRITLFDYDADVWSVCDFQFNLENQLFLYAGHKHDIHPAKPVMVSAALKLLGREYTNYYYEHGHRHSAVYDAIPPHLTTVNLIRAEQSSKLYLLEYISTDNTGNAKNPIVMRRVDGLLEPFMKLMFLSPSHAMTVTQRFLDSVPLTQMQFHPQKTDRLYGIVTSSGKCYVVVREKIVAIKDFVMLRLAVPEHLIIRDFPDVFIPVMGVELAVDELPPIFRDGTLMRASNDKQVYVNRKFMRLPIASASVFFANGWDFDNVISIHDLIADIYFDLLPMGPTLT